MLFYGNISMSMFISRLLSARAALFILFVISLFMGITTCDPPLEISLLYLCGHNL